MIIPILRKNWFLFGIVAVIILAKFAPGIGSKGGILYPEITVKYCAVFIIFFNSGISLKTEELAKAVSQVKIHVFVQFFTYCFFPFIIKCLVLLLESLVPFEKLLLDGLLILSCMPPPVSSAVILTRAVGGNEAAAIFNSALGSFLGIFITPALVLELVGSTAHVPANKILIQLSSTVVLPIVLGQIVRRNHKLWLEQLHLPLGEIGSGILLLIIYTTFCDTFSHQDLQVDQFSLVSLVLLIILIQVLLMLLVFYTTTHPAISFHPQDTVALLYCCTHKSLTLGIPIIKIIFGNDDSLSVITISLLIYHPVQILLGGLLVPLVREWLATSRYIR
ncbi:hypothetical protein LOTGIDRAFT_112710 [Lottia gigantea]|uniref:Sodium/bile acid cotransporter n=1 Tax=Lottia gigantea TaxID=225164 RepID=V4CDH5_LOTGI|nr:hypothetical protein LOTGIDRAFT_112710 [Lottia gigantea]ESO99959.1 hypothetical protein LOTGIDRAFT_112710 [Lottia gigantea]